MAYPKETVEAAVGILELAKVLAYAAKDGLQFSDLAIVAQKLNEEPVKSKIEAAKQGLDKVQEEIKDVKLEDAFQIIAVLGPEIVDLVYKIGKKA